MRSPFMNKEVNKMIEMTVSDLYAFKQCPLRYKLAHIDKLIRQLSRNDGIRESMKSTISYYFHQRMEGEEPGENELKEKLSNMWFGEMGLFDIKFNDNYKKREEFLKAAGMLNYFYRQEKNNQDKIIAVNLDFRIPFDNGFSIKGVIPLIRKNTRGYEIVIHKTGRQKYDEFWQNTDMEVTLIAMAFESIFKQPVDSIMVRNLYSAQTFFVYRQKKDYRRLNKTIKMVQKSIEKGWFYPCESYGCAKCPVKKYCTEWN